MTKLLTIDLRSTAPRMLGSRGTPSQFVLYGLKNMCAKFDAFTRFVTIFPLTDRTTLRFRSLNFAGAGARKKKHPKRTVSMVMVRTVKSRPTTNQSEHSI